VSTLTYRLPAFVRAERRVSLVLFPAGVLTMIGASLTQGKGGPPVGFILVWLVWLALFASVYFQLLFRYCDHVELTDEVLRWWAPLAHGEMRLADLRLIAPAGRAGGSSRFTPVAGKPILVPIRRGFTDFVAQVQIRAPQVTVRLGWHAKHVERFPGPSAFPG
jgi:hypothetical protein